MPTIETPRGTRDFRPAEMARRRAAEAVYRRTFERFGYQEIQTPTFEHLELFTLKSGPNVVGELYNFKDKGDRDITLRPELTAPVIRFFVNDLSREPRPLKLYYFGNCFRYERPQSGRYREFWQFGTELIGPTSPEADAEVIALAVTTLKALGLKEYGLRVGHIGVLKGIAADLGLSEEDRFTLFRIIDKDEFDARRLDVSDILARAKTPDPGAMDVLDFIAHATGGEEVLADAKAYVKPGSALEQALAQLAQIGKFLTAAGITDFQYDLGVVRGLDYYTGMVFEVEAPVLGAEKQIVGGGAYSLSELFGGEPVGSVGFGMGFDRILLALEREGGAPTPSLAMDVYVAPIGEDARAPAVELVTELRNAGLKAEVDLQRRGPSKNLDYANHRAARKVVLMGAKELAQGIVTVKDMTSGEQKTVPRGDVLKHVA
ncbi:MAG TPA: histidine--tRNA ligase [Candidatus Thermoplasmatota archaeon]|nr:histidine--tRNA ligase [Candidatus Thermoplasmatota archaeon]